MFQNLDQWTMRQSLLELQLMIKQTANNVSKTAVFGAGQTWAKNFLGLLLEYVWRLQVLGAEFGQGAGAKFG